MLQWEHATEFLQDFVTEIEVDNDLNKYYIYSIISDRICVRSLQTDKHKIHRQFDDFSFVFLIQKLVSFAKITLFTRQ